MSDHVEQTIIARASTHGDFLKRATICQDIKVILYSSGNWFQLEADERDALELIAVKISRILSGDPDEPDHWRDLAGYARLVERRLAGDAP